MGDFRVLRDSDGGEELNMGTSENLNQLMKLSFANSMQMSFLNLLDAPSKDDLMNAETFEHVISDRVLGDDRSLFKPYLDAGDRSPLCSEPLDSRHRPPSYGTLLLAYTTLRKMHMRALGFSKPRPYAEIDEAVQAEMVPYRSTPRYYLSLLQWELRRAEGTSAYPNRKPNYGLVRLPDNYENYLNRWLKTFVGSKGVLRSIDGDDYPWDQSEYDPASRLVATFLWELNGHFLIEGKQDSLKESLNRDSRHVPEEKTIVVINDGGDKDIYLRLYTLWILGTKDRVFGFLYFIEEVTGSEYRLFSGGNSLRELKLTGNAMGIIHRLYPKSEGSNK